MTTPPPSPASAPSGPPQSHFGPPADRPPEDQPFRPDPRQVDRRELDRLVSAGRIRRLPGSVLVADHVPDTVALRARAVALALAPPGGGPMPAPAARAVVGYATAAWVHAGGAAPDLVDLVIAPGSARPKNLPARLHEHRLGPRELLSVGTLRLTDPIRTGADLARSLPPAELGPALHRLGAACGVRLIDVLDQLDRMHHGRGVATARQVVHAWASAIASSYPASDQSGVARQIPTAATGQELWVDPLIR